MELQSIAYIPAPDKVMLELLKKKGNTMKIFKCHECGYTKEAAELPQGYVCPLCDEPGSSFVVADASYIERKHINEPAESPGEDTK
ncbi:MAG TPA: hypothetical protein GX717_03660 [Clostridiaceae bacterium]|nr:hypothetical protein [Clostridiaceae bacterium]